MARTTADRDREGGRPPVAVGPPGRVAGAVAAAGALLPAAGAGRRLRLRHREAVAALLSLLPAFLLVGVIVWYPIGRAFYHGFTEWNGATSTWVGLDNYARILRSPEFHGALRTNAIFALAIPGILLLSVVVAVLLFEETPGWRLFRSVYYIPTILSAAVVGLLMRFLFATRGPVNAMLDGVGLGALQQDWLSSVPTAFLVLIFVFYWQTLGQGVLIFLAGLAAIPGDLLEAATLDGAGWWRRLTGIIVPQLVPAIAYFVVINLIWVFIGLFALIYTVTRGGPGYATNSVDFLIYRKAFESGEFGYASALAVILFVAVLTISAIQIRWFDRLSAD